MDKSLRATAKDPSLREAATALQAEYNDIGYVPEPLTRTLEHPNE